MDNIITDDTEVLVQKMLNKIHSAYYSYHIWKWLEQARNINIGEEKANRNIQILNQQPTFFSVAIQGAFYNFIIDLSIFLDDNKSHKQSLSLNKLLSRIKISNEDRKLIDDILLGKKAIIYQIKNKIRDKEVAHFDTNVDRSQSNIILYKEAEGLFEAVHEIFNILSSTFNNSIWIWDTAEGQINDEMNYLLDNMELGEQTRKEELNKKLLDSI
ncbi:MAG: hypothetical protein WCO09_00550 [bacterium]